MFEIGSRTYYVYHHTYKGNVFYIGMGKSGRAFGESTANRTKRWHDFVSNLPNKEYSIKIVEVFKSREEALDAEKKAILKLRPITNKVGYGKTFKSRRMYTGEPMTPSEMGKRGAKITNKLLTPEMRAKAAKKGWRNRKAKLKDKVKVR